MDKNTRGIVLSKFLYRVGIIVAIILVIIIIRKFSNRLTLSKFYSGFSDYCSAVEKKSRNESVISVTGKTSKPKELIYYQVATGKTFSSKEDIVSTGLIENIGISPVPSSALKGTEYFEILDDSVLAEYGYRKNVFFYGKNKYEERHYITDLGVVFTLPGFYVNDNGVEKYYITPTVYYCGDKVNGKGNITDYVKVGDYVKYEPDRDNYVAPSDETGYTSNQTFSTASRTWRVWSIAKNGMVTLVPTNPVNEIHLVGSKGYYNGADEINTLCKNLYSSDKYDAVARSMRVSDIEENALYDKTTYVGNTLKYGKTKLYDAGVHYSYEENGETKYRIKYASKDDEAIVKQTEYAYYPIDWKSIDGNSDLLKEILGEKYSWLATRCTSVEDDIAYYGMQIVSGKNIDKARLCDSNNGKVNDSVFAIRPIVELNIGTDVVAGEGEDGATPQTAWKLKKVR